MIELCRCGAYFDTDEDARGFCSVRCWEGAHARQDLLAPVRRPRTLTIADGWRIVAGQAVTQSVPGFRRIPKT